MLGAVVALWLSLFSPEKKGLSLPSDPPASSPEDIPLLCDYSDDSTSNEGHSTNDSDSESEAFEDVVESEQIGKDDTVTSNVDSINDLDSAEMNDSVDNVNTHDSVDDPTANDDVDGFVSAASTTVPSDEDDRSSVLFDDSSDVTGMDDLGDTTCAPRKR